MKLNVLMIRALLLCLAFGAQTAGADKVKDKMPQRNSPAITACIGGIKAQISALKRKAAEVCSKEDDDCEDSESGCRAAPPECVVVMEQISALQVQRQACLKLAPVPAPAPVPVPAPVPIPAPTPTNADATFSYISKNILQPKCLGCHGNSGGYSFASYTSTMKAVSAKNAAGSLLYTSTNSGAMPTSGKLSAMELKAIYDWIQAGALNN